MKAAKKATVTMSNTTSTTIPAGKTSANQSYNSYDHVVVSGALTGATLTENPTGLRGTIEVANGGTITNTTATGQAEIDVDSGGTATSTILNGFGADLTVKSGATVNQVSASHSATISATGGNVSNVTIDDANLTIGSGANVTTVTATDSANIDLDAGGSLTSATVTNGGYLGNIGGTVTSATIGNGGSVLLDGGSITGVVISSGGELQVDKGTATDVGLKTGGRIDFSTLKYDSSAGYNYNSATHTLTVTGSGGTAHVTLDPNTSDIVVDGQQFNLVEDSDGSLAIETCFLAGSMIQTPQGDVPVENIRLGDDITVYVDGKTETRSIIWAGKAHTTVRPERPDDEAGYPVRVLKDAIADGVPYKDMLITAEHCLFFKGRFVPVRMLVNGVSIFYDKSITSYDYYHVETEQHSVIRADGMLTESYLDTGNRSSFRQEGSVIMLGGKPRTWEHDAGAPLCVDRSFVEPLFRRGNLTDGVILDHFLVVQDFLCV